MPLGGLRAYKALSFKIPYWKILQMCLSEPLPPTRHFPLKSFIKNYYKCASRSLSRLQGIFPEKSVITIITSVPLGGIRVYEAYPTRDS